MDQVATSLNSDQKNAFVVFCRKHYYIIFHFFRKRTLGIEESEDLTQETFMRAYRNTINSNPVDPSLAWLLTIASNLWKNWLRDQTANKRQGTVIDLDSLSQFDGWGSSSFMKALSQSPFDQIVARETIDRVDKAMRTLPKQMQRCFIMRYVHDRTDKEIACILQIQHRTVRSQLSQARKKLQEILKEMVSGMEEEV